MNEQGKTMKEGMAETVADIVAEMRKRPPEGDETPAGLACSLFADRIEAAAKRESTPTTEKSSAVGNAAMRDEVVLRLSKDEYKGMQEALSEHDRLCEMLSESRKSIGNAAAMREALLSVRKAIDYRGGDLARYTLPVIDAALKTPSEPAGNAAMVRMALEALWDVIDQFSKNILDGQMQLVLSDMLIPAKNAYHHALAASPRNCDVGTAGEQARRYAQHCDTYLRDDGSKPCTGCPCCGKVLFGKCEFAWAQMPYEAEGGAE